MFEAVRPTRRRRRAFAFLVSLGGHTCVLAWVALAPLMPPPRPGLYEQEIRPFEKTIVWYKLNDRLPEIAPPERDLPIVSRARVRSPQNVVSGPRDNLRPPQLIWTPAPEIEARRVLPAPNVVALPPPARPLRDFTPPDLERTPGAAPVLPAAPQIPMAGVERPEVAPPPRPQPRLFRAPTSERPADILGTLAAAPELAVATEQTLAAAKLLPPIQAARRTFIPPAEAPHAPLPRSANLAPAPPIENKSEPAPPLLPGASARLLRPFAAPGRAAAAAPSPATPLADAPPTGADVRATEVALAIVSLFPRPDAAIPALQSPQRAGFSAGPQPHQAGGDSGSHPNQLTVPGLLAHSEAQDRPPDLLAVLEPPTSRANLGAASRSVQAAGSAPVATLPMRQVSPPDPRLAGRLVYTIAIQMPNVSSYSGSWVVWFAESHPIRDQKLPEMKAPQPLRKVDPKYFPAALDEKVEGKVRLAAVIRKDGRVEHVELLQHLDDRLDQSSQEALARWQFSPATRNGVPVDVDAVFEIPFHIAPKVPK